MILSISILIACIDKKRGFENNLFSISIVVEPIRAGPKAPLSNIDISSFQSYGNFASSSYKVKNLGFNSPGYALSRPIHYFTSLVSSFFIPSPT